VETSASLIGDRRGNQDFPKVLSGRRVEVAQALQVALKGADRKKNSVSGGFGQCDEQRICAPLVPGMNSESEAAADVRQQRRRPSVGGAWRA
jgi:hypothetical protein